ncbi:MAG: hypothetical protein IJP90_12210 [Treponema sp.]|nr:hypothetical protein [Treponema sp.]
MSLNPDGREKKIGFISDTMTGFYSVMRNLQEDYATYHQNYSEEALALLSRSDDFIESVEVMRSLDSLSRIDDEGINKLFLLSQQITELYHLDSSKFEKDANEKVNISANNNIDINTFTGWIVRLNSLEHVESIEYRYGNDVLVIYENGEKILHQYPGIGSRAGFLAKYIGMPINSNGTSPETENILNIAGYNFSSQKNIWEKTNEALPIFSIYGTSLPKNNIVMKYFRDSKSYSPSFDRNNPINEYLDTLLMSNLTTGEKLEIKEIQTVANYPNTTSTGAAHKNTYNDTIAPGNVQFRFKTTSSVAPGECLVIINAKTLDGRKVNHNGYTEKALSAGRGLVHSSANPSTGIAYNHAYSEQCFICKRIEDYKLIINTLVRWGCKDGDIIQGEVINKQNRVITEETKQQSVKSFKTTKTFNFSKNSYVPVEGIGILGGATFTGSITMTNSRISIFASGFLVAQNLVDKYEFLGEVTLAVDDKTVEKQYFQYPNYSFISEGAPFIPIGDANFDYDFSNAKSIVLYFQFKVRIDVDYGVNKRFINYSKERIKIK